MTMHALFKLLHLAAAIVWLGGMSFLLLALRPSLGMLETPAQRLRLMAVVLRRFFAAVWVAVGVLLLTGSYLLGHADARTLPLGWSLMSGLGLLMVLIYSHLYFAAYRRMQQAVASADWPAAAERAPRIARLAGLNLVLGWLAVSAITLLA